MSLACAASSAGGGEVAHHQEADGVHAEVARGGEVRGRDVRFGAVRADTHDAGSRAARIPEVAHAADAGQQKRCDAGALNGGSDRLDPFQVGVGAESVHAARTGQPVTVRNFDRIDAGRVKGGRDRGDLLDAVLVADRMHAVAQGDVADVDVLGHGAAPAFSLAKRSAVAMAAEVTMSTSASSSTVTRVPMNLPVSGM